MKSLYLTDDQLFVIATCLQESANDIKTALEIGGVKEDEVRFVRREIFIILMKIKQLREI